MDDFIRFNLYTVHDSVFSNFKATANIYLQTYWTTAQIQLGSTAAPSAVPATSWLCDLRVSGSESTTKAPSKCWRYRRLRVHSCPTKTRGGEFVDADDNVNISRVVRTTQSGLLETDARTSPDNVKPREPNATLPSKDSRISQRSGLVATREWGDLNTRGVTWNLGNPMQRCLTKILGFHSSAQWTGCYTEVRRPQYSPSNSHSPWRGGLELPSSWFRCKLRRFRRRGRGKSPCTSRCPGQSWSRSSRLGFCIEWIDKLDG